MGMNREVMQVIGLLINGIEGFGSMSDHTATAL
jgi:hypothetical protein